MKHRLFVLFSIIMTLLTLFVCFYIYDTNIILPMQTKKQSQLSQLDMYSTKLSSTVEQILHNAREYGMDAEFQAASGMLARLGKIDDVTKIRLLDKMRLIMISRPYIANIRLIHPYQPYVFDSLLEYHLGGEFHSGWVELFERSNLSTEFIIHKEDRDQAAAVVVTRFPFHNLKIKNVMVLFEIDIKKLLVFISGKEENIRYETLDDDAYGDTGYVNSDSGTIQFYKFSPIIDGYIVKSMDEQELFLHERNLMPVVWVLFFFLVVLAIAASRILAIYTTKPVLKVLDWLNDTFGDNEAEASNSTWTGIRQSMEKVLSEHEQMKAGFSSYLPLMLERYHYKLIKGHYKEWKEIEKNSLFLRNRFETDELLGIILVEADEILNEHSQQFQMVRLHIQNYIQEHKEISKDSHLVEEANNRLYMLYYLPKSYDESAFYVHSQKMIRNMQLRLSKLMNMTFSSFIGFTGLDPQTVHQTYRKLDHLSRRASSYGNGKIMVLNESVSTLGLHDAEAEYDWDMELDKWSNFITMPDSDEFDKEFHHLMERIKETDNDAIMKEHFIEIVVWTRKFIRMKGLNRDVIAGYENYEEILASKSFEDIGVMIWTLISKVREQMDLKRQSMGEFWINKVKGYVEMNIRNQDLSVSSISDDLNLSPTHVGRLFKNYTGMSLVDYINDCRIELSKNELIHSNKKIFEIAVWSGFVTPHYFNKIFKQKTGLTPTAYRKMKSNMTD